MKKNTVLVTGSAGFIGYHLSEKLLELGYSVIGVDNFNSYYDVKLKEARNSRLMKNPLFTIYKGDICDEELVSNIIISNDIETVYHLAAQAGVRYSIENPQTYIKNNIEGTLSVLESIRRSQKKPQLLLASSSSVYGLSKNFPFSEADAADTPASLYGATKRSTELIARSYSHLFGLTITALRFFTVYGPWGRPDMALFKFIDNLYNGKAIELYNNGDMIRDFTYIDDIIDGIILLTNTRKSATENKYDVFNIGSSNPRSLSEYIAAIKSATKMDIKIVNLPFQAGDIYKTFADVSKLSELTNYKPKFSIEQGVLNFVNWYKDYYLK